MTPGTWPRTSAGDPRGSLPGHPDPRKGAYGFRNFENINDMPTRLLRHFARDAIDDGVVLLQLFH